MELEDDVELPPHEEPVGDEMPIEAQQTKQQQRAALAALAARKQAEQRPTRDEKGEGEAGPREKKKKRKTDRTTTIGGEGKRRRRTDEAAEAAGYFSEDGEDDGENLDNRAQAIADANESEPEENAEDRAFIEAEDDDDKNMPWAGGDTDDEDEPLPEEEEAEGAAKKPKKGGKKAKAKGAAVNVEAAEEDPVMAILMGKKKKSARPAEGAQHQRLQLAAMLVTEMRRACDRDHRSNEAAAPALERLKLCRQVEAAALEAEMRAPLLQEGLLTELRRWLELMPDRSLPNATVRTTVLRALDSLALNVNDDDDRKWLKEARVGPLVMFLTRCRDETPANARLAAAIVEKWSRPIVEARAQELAEEEQERAQGRDRAAAGPARHLAPVERAPVPGMVAARMPQPALLDYARLPSLASEGAEKGRGKAQDGGMRRLLKERMAQGARR